MPRHAFLPGGHQLDESDERDAFLPGGHQVTEAIVTFAGTVVAVSGGSGHMLTGPPPPPVQLKGAVVAQHALQGDVSAHALAGDVPATINLKGEV